MLPPLPRCPHCRQPFNRWALAKKHVKYCRRGRSPRTLRRNDTNDTAVSSLPLDTAPANSHPHPPKGDTAKATHNREYQGYTR